jgi:hypothetical protein
LAQRSSRQKRKKRRAANQAAVSRGYARGREKDEAIRAELKPLRPGERPTAVTVGAIVAVLAALGNAVAVIVNIGDGDPRKLEGTALPVVLLLVVAWGMWRAKYWAVLGMQTLLALTMVGAALAGIQAQNLRAALVVLGLFAICGPLFWFLVKAMARIQMPTPPSARR